MLSFLDAFSGYHHIPMHPPDAKKTSFITPHGLYRYNVMPFGLKNAGATYQRLVTKMFRPLLGSTMVALRSFISLFTDRLNPFFATLRGANQAEWNEECDRAFMAIKQYLTEPPILVSPEACDTLYLYLAASNIVVSAALFKECEDAKLRHVFFVSKSLTDAETRYSHLERVALALRTAAQKLRPYFQAHPIVVLTDLPLRGTIHRPDLSGRMARWAMELSEFEEGASLG